MGWSSTPSSPTATWCASTRTATPRPLTTGTGLRFADLRIDRPADGCWRSWRTTGPTTWSPTNSIVAVGLDDGAVTPLVDGHDFFSHPRLSPDGDALCWLTWDRPNMPWDGSELWVGRLDDDGSVGSLGPRRGRHRPSPSRARPGHPMAASCSPRTARAGGTCIAGGRARRASRRWRRWRPSSPSRSGSSASASSGSMARAGSSPSPGPVVATDCWSWRPVDEPRAIELDATDLHGLSVAGDIAVLRRRTARRRPTAVVRIDLAHGRGRAHPRGEAR